MSEKILGVQAHCLLWLTGAMWKHHIKDTVLMNMGRKPKQHTAFVILLNTHLKLINEF